MRAEARNVELVGIGVGGVRSGSDRALLNGSFVDLDWVNVNAFLGVIAACSAKKITALVPGLSMVVVSVYAYGSLEKEEISWLEVSVEARGSASKETVLDALWKCPIMRFMKDKIRNVTIEVSA